MLLLLLVLGALVLAAACADIVYRAVSTVPAMADPTQQMGAASQLYDGGGAFVELLPSLDDRQPVNISQVPPLVQEAFIATEDRTFQTNIGISFKGIARAALNDVLHRGHLQGASTISQQVARTLYLSQRETLTRKLREAVLAIELNRRYTKDEILDMYLNDVYLGPNIRGVEAAAQAYFNQSDLSKLTLPQMALLAGLPQAPSSYDPLVHPQAARTRRNQVLEFMREQGYITAAQARQAEAAPLGLAPGQTAQANANYPYPWIVDEVIRELEQAPFNMTSAQIESGGYKVYTTFDPTLETAAVQAVQDQMNRLDPRAGAAGQPELESALVLLDQHTGNILAIVGGREHTGALDFDRATQGQRQPGSSIKPIVDYIPALENGMTAGTVVDDVIHAYQPGPNQPQYLPEDDALPYYGLTTLTEALRRSVNTVAVQVLDRIGIQAGYANAIKMGLPLVPADEHLSLAIGGVSGQTCCSALQMAAAYAAIANGGARATPRLITKVVAPDGSVLVNNPVQFTQVVDPRIAFVMTQMLETVMESTEPDSYQVIPPNGWDSDWGTGNDADVQDNVPGWPTAGKTGTTDNNTDLWFVGYTPLYTAAVWVGHDHNQPMPNDAYGDTYAGPIFQKVMEAAVAGHAVAQFPEPPGVLQAPIDAKCAPWHVCSPGPLTPAQWVRNEWFVAGTQPTPATSQNIWVQEKVTDTDPPLLWNQYCTGTPVERVFLNRLVEPDSWAEDIAAAKNTSDYAQFFPTDQDGSTAQTYPTSAPPTQACSPPAGSLAPTGGGGATAQGGGTAAGGCQEDWTITVGPPGEPTQPALACILVGRTATLNFVSGDGQPHDVVLQGYTASGTVPGDGTPLALTVSPAAVQTTLIIVDGLDAGRIAVEDVPASTAGGAPGSSTSASTGASGGSATTAANGGAFASSTGASSAPSGTAASSSGAPAGSASANGSQGRVP